MEARLAQGLDPTLVFVDLDGFGDLNKRFGHPFGDQVLKALAERLKAFAQGLGGEAYRYGGDEFALLFPKPRAAVLPHLEALWQPPLTLEGVAIGFSLGLSGGRRRNRHPENAAANADDLIRLASQASTLAKRLGRPLAFGEDV
ncbi:GGDEF domain-containing protein [Thermus sediminis]|uniref:GGDEF domain-containing protein n=1 Tax=Thermus sediminis TaxID=1761908 RepID=UPI001E473AEE|nr:GGDEF domain-containing protein [Thermus sediminis]